MAIGDTLFNVELAITPDQRARGLSNRPGLARDDGMLFIFEQAATHTFWMKDMRFPLDMVWIGLECTIVDITYDAPPPSPGQTLDDLPRYTPRDAAVYVLEINSGVANSAGLQVGDQVRFGGNLAQAYRC